MRKLKMIVSVFLIMSMFCILGGCSDEDSSDKGENNKEITREDEMKDNKSIYMVTSYKDEAGMYHYCGIDGEGKLVEFTSDFPQINNFYKGYAIAKKSGKAYLIGFKCQKVENHMCLHISGFTTC